MRKDEFKERGIELAAYSDWLGPKMRWLEQANPSYHRMVESSEARLPRNWTLERYRELVKITERTIKNHTSTKEANDIPF